jgi:hypothetical protein
MIIAVDSLYAISPLSEIANNVRTAIYPRGEIGDNILEALSPLAEVPLVYVTQYCE